MNPPSPPTPPNPQQTAAAQTGSNVNTALAQAQLNNVNQNTPYGSINYTQSPGTSVSDGNGGTLNVPQYTATQTLSPTEQNLFNLGQQTQTNLGNIGVQQSQKIGDILNTPVDLSPQNVSDQLTQLGNARLQPILNQQWQQTESDLMNRGVMPGSQAYNQAQDAFNRQSNDAYNQLVLNGYNTGVQTMLQQRDEPINEVSALLSGSQVQQPNFANTPQTQVQPTNVAGITNNAFQNQMGLYNSQLQQNNAMMGGLFGLGSAAMPLLMF